MGEIVSLIYLFNTYLDPFLRSDINRFAWLVKRAQAYLAITDDRKDTFVLPNRKNKDVQKMVGVDVAQTTSIYP